MFRVLAIGLSTLVLSGCGKPLQKGDIALGKDDAFYVFGLGPSNSKVQIFPGSIDGDGRFTPDPLLSATFNGLADQGYAVGRAKAGSVLAVSRVFLMGTGSILAPVFVPCADAKTISFTAAKGKVIYLADVEYRFSGEKLEVGYGTDIEAARKYLEANFPNLAPHLEQGELHFAKTSIPCKSTIYIPIYLPR
jgi:hypothetical protein